MTITPAPRTFPAGTVLRRHTDGDTVILSTRKADDSGWWLLDGGGLADFMIEREWTRLGVPSAAEILAWHEAAWPDKPDITVGAKLAEEAGEVCGALIKRDEGRRTTADVLDELGDVAVVLNVLAARHDTTVDALLTRRFAEVRYR